MLAPSEHSEAAVAAAPTTEIATTTTTDNDITEQGQGDSNSNSCQDNLNQVLDLLIDKKEEIREEEEKSKEVVQSERESAKDSEPKGEEVPVAVNEENDVIVRESPEIPQKVAFTENECSGDDATQEQVPNSGVGEVMEGQLISLDMGDTKVEEVKEKVEESSEKRSGSGDVLEILNKLESMKTPEPDEVDSGIVRASFVDFTMDEQEPVEEQSDDDDDDNDDDDDDEGTNEGESVEIFQVGDMAASNPELQKIREEQVRKWLKFEEENPMTEKMNGVIISEKEGMEDGEDGEMMTVNGEDGMPRRVRFLTDTEGNLLISVFMSKLVHLFLFFLKVASAGYLDLVSFTRSNSSTSSTTSTSFYNCTGSMQQQLPIISSHQQCNQSLNAPTTSSCIINIDETDRNDGNESRLMIVIANNESHFSTPTTESASEEGSLTSSNGGNAAHAEAPALVVSPPSLDPQINGELLEQPAPVPTAPPMEDDSDDDEPEPPSIVLVEPLVPKEPPKEKPPAPPIDEIDEGCNSSDETLSVSSCNSMIEIMPQNQNKFELEQDVSGETNSLGLSGLILDGMEELDSLNDAPVIQITDEAKVDSEAPATQSPATALTPVFHIDKPEENEEVASNESSQPASFIIHDLEENEIPLPPMNEAPPAQPQLIDDIIKLPTIDENNNVVDAEDSEENMPPVPESEIKHEIDIHAEENNVPMPDLRLSHSSSSSQSDGEEERFISALSEQLPSVREPQMLQPPNHGVSNGDADDEDEEHLMSLRIQEEHISSVALTIAKWESMSKAQSTENLATSPIHPPVTKCSSSPCPKLVKSLATAIEQVNPVPVVPLNPFPVATANIPQNGQCISPALVDSNNNYDNNYHKNNKDDNCNSSNNNATNTTAKTVSVNNALNSAEPIVVNKAPGWNCWGNKIKDPKPLVDPAGPIDSDEIIYAQPNHQAGSTMTSIANPSAILKQYPKPISKGEIVMWLKEGEIHRAGLLLNYGQSHHHAPVLATPHNVSPVLVSWFFGLISRHQAEKYLHGQPPGTFLVRISTRIWGYTLSYQGANGRTKHFLISAINPAVPATLQANPEAALPPQTGKQQRMSPFVPQGRYAFIGTNMTPYGTLVSLIRHHSHAPITKLGGEKLLNPCPGGPQVAGLENLFKCTEL